MLMASSGDAAMGAVHGGTVPRGVPAALCTVHTHCVHTYTHACPCKGMCASHVSLWAS